MASSTDDYVLGRDLYGSLRLDAQHLLWKLFNGYTMNPKIPVYPGMRIAEIGTGTGTWLLDLASQLPQTVRLEGYDLSDGQFPHKSVLPANVSLNTLNAFKDVPLELVEKYDVVHLRFWCCVVKHNNPIGLIQHAMKLLKPGGYIQWEDADLGRTIIRGDKAEEFGRVASSIFKGLNLNFEWISNIQTHILQNGLTVLDGETSSFPPHLIPLVTNTYLIGHTELFQSIDKLNDSSIPTERDCHKLLQAAAMETKNGALYHWAPVTLLAQKPLGVSMTDANGFHS